jgi:hypothetical protein
MQNAGAIIMTIQTLTRQFLNCWLEYVLSQPVDIDMSVMLHFLRTYLCIPFVLSLFRKDASDDESLLTAEEENLIPDLVPQKSFS